jgi:hydroxyacylglutathione hydrolase
MVHIKTFTFNAFSENTYILFDDNKEAIVFDPGCYTSQERQTLKNFITDKNLSVKKLINTHCHLDHIFGNDFISETYNVELELHRNEIPVLEKAHLIGDMYGVPMQPQTAPPSDYTKFIEDGDLIEVGEIRLKAILCPGHSPGSLCFYNEEQSFLIGGDVLFYGSIGRTDLPGGNHKQLIEGIHSRLMILPEDTKVYSGHGPATMIGFEKYNNPFLS